MSDFTQVIQLIRGRAELSGGSVVKSLLANARDMGLIPGSGKSPG